MACRRPITVAEKVEWLAQFDAGVPIAEVANAAGRSRKTVRTVCVQEREAVETHARALACVVQQERVRRVRKPELLQLERDLYEYIVSERLRNTPLLTAMIQGAAMGLAAGHTALQFVASNGWFHGFVRRFGLKNMRLVGETATANVAAADRYKCMSVLYK